MSDFKFGDMVKHPSLGAGLVNSVTDLVGGDFRVRVIFEGRDGGVSFDSNCEAGYNTDQLTLIARPQGWISLVDEYPEADTEVLVCDEKYPDIDTTVDFITFHPEYGEMWANGAAPTHWMPLPKPPKELL